MMIFCITEYYVVLLIMIHVQLMAAMRYFDRMESEMSGDQCENFDRKLVLTLAPRFGERLQSSASGAALLDEALQVGQYLIYCILFCIICLCPLWNNSHAFQTQKAESNGLDAFLP
jgi:hypothetical protein